MMNISKLIAVSNSLNTLKHEMLERKVLALEVNMSSLRLLMVNKVESIDIRRQKVLSNLAKQQNRLKFTISRMFREQTTLKNNIEKFENLSQQLQSRIQMNTENISESYSELDKIVTEVKEVNYTSAQASRSIDSMKSDLYQMSSSVNEFKEALGNSLEQCRKSTQRLGLEMQESQLKIEQNFTEFQSVLDNYIISIQNNTHGLIVLRNSQSHCTKRLDNLEGNISAITTATEQLEYLVSDVRTLNGAIINVSTNIQNVENLKSIHLQVQKDLTTVKVSSSMIWRQCNETARKVENVSEMFAFYDTRNSNQLELLMEDIRALQDNVSLYWNSVGNERAIVDKLSRRIDTLQENVFQNFTLHYTFMNTRVAENVYLLETNMTLIKHYIENLQRVFQHLNSITQQNAKNISLCNSTVSELSAKINDTNHKLHDTMRKQLLITSNLDNITKSVKEHQMAFKKSTKDCCNLTMSRVSHLEKVNFTKLQSDFDYLTSSMQNHSNKMFHVENSNEQQKAKLVRLEKDITGITMTMKNLETQISDSSVLNNVFTNVTTNKQNIRHLLSFSFDLQQNVSLIQLFLSKVWRQCNSTEEYVQNMKNDWMSIQDLSSRSVKLKKDLQAIRELSSIVWHQCNKSEEQAMNISTFVSELNVSNARQHKSLEQKLFATKENISSLYTFVTNDAGKVNTLNETIKDLQQIIFHNLTRQKHFFNSIMAEKFQLLETNFSNIKNITNHLRLSMQILRSDIQQNAKNITIYHAEISKMASEQNKAIVHIASIKTVQSNLSRISKSFKELRRDVNKSINEGNNFTFTYISKLETHVQMIKNNISEFHGDLHEVMTSVQNLSHGIATLYRIQEGYKERFTVLEGSLSVIANTTTNLELVTSSLFRFDDAISNVCTANANNFRDLRLTSSELQQNLSSLWNLSSMIWQQCNTTDDRVQNISTIVKVNPFFEEELWKIQFNISAIASYVEWFANETRNILSDQADKQNALTNNLERNLIKYINSSEELEERIKENHIDMMSLMKNLSIFENNLDQISTEMSMNKEAIDYVQHNLTALFKRVLNSSIDGQFDMELATQSTTQSFVRLVGGSSASEGRVEVFHGGVWGTVCDDSWDSGDATVVCRMLGYTGRASAFERARFGPGIGSILMDEVHCTGLEDSIFSCYHNGFGSHDCGHSEDASVSCS
uniref:227 kDa spindle- and centromere-associated protein-like isoform X3 n=1 Tax=Crassostrea virginica TaxID=6565 RepID=A0A8B8ABJ3_CRAVI|nr:227 kDa spindle- and centromere-associated protein-like isoform X3 [Crassostrea virginica]